MVSIDIGAWWNAKEINEKANVLLSDLAHKISDDLQNNYGIITRVLVRSSTDVILQFAWTDGQFSYTNMGIRIYNNSGHLIDNPVYINECVLSDAETTIDISYRSDMIPKSNFPPYGTSTFKFIMRYDTETIKGVAIYGLAIFREYIITNYLQVKAKHMRTGEILNAILSDGDNSVRFRVGGRSRRFIPTHVLENSASIMVYPFNDGTYKVDNLYYSSGDFNQLRDLKNPTISPQEDFIYHNAFRINDEDFGVIQGNEYSLTYIFKERTD